MLYLLSVGEVVQLCRWRRLDSLSCLYSLFVHLSLIFGLFMASQIGRETFCTVSDTKSRQLPDSYCHNRHESSE